MVEPTRAGMARHGEDENVTKTRLGTTVSQTRELLAKAAHWPPKGRWCELPPEYDFIDVYGDGDVTWNSVYVEARLQGSYSPGFDSFPAKLCIRPLFTKKGNPRIARMANNITHEYVHYWLHVHEDETTSGTFDNVYDKRSCV